ncbi:DUF5686 family protein [Carboxylicivirga caseinilyticus]|uniref:DUF5686 family protein n=1 Tax=Carboxylicivirga caseinilyticus TaxID=3417572 RepID=UPI003D32F108|nr:carboxypeptidase-like regulatory domain-containing protein [Marinilabiliaceae bacterium A049]
MPTKASKYLTYFFLSILIAGFTKTTAQEINGVVVDAITRQSIPFVNVAYGDQKGTITDIDGKFKIAKIESTDNIRFSCLGYYPFQLKSNEIDPFLTIKLQPIQYELDEINVVPGENPAVAIMRNVIENSDQHNPSLYQPFSCILYHKMIVEYDMPEEIREEELPKLMNDLGLSKDSYLMLFESVSEKRHFKKGMDKERILSGRVSGMKNATLASLPAMLQPFSFYDQYLKILDSDYLNPASKPGLNNYYFQLLDTIVDNKGDSIYYISYNPKPTQNFRGLSGTFHIQKSDWAIKSVVAKTAGSNKGLSLYIKQNYQPTEEGFWFPHQLESSLEFKSIGSSQQLPYPLIGKGKSYVTAINTKPDFTARDFDNVVFEDATLAQTSPEVGLYRYEPLTARDSLTYHLLDSIGKRAHLDAIINLQLSMIKGYLPAGKFQLDLRRFFDYNDFEGFKIGLGIYTSPKISTKFSTGGYITYGFGDKEWKYGGSFFLTPFKRDENRFIIDYKDDVFATGELSFLDGVQKNSAEIFRGLLTETMDRTQEIKLGTEFRFLRYFKTGLYYKNATVTPKKSYRFLETDEVAPEFDFQEASVKLKWAHRETFTNSALGFLSEGTNYPTVWINGTYGQWQQNGTFNYQKLEAQVEKTFNYPNAMYTNLRVQGGKLFGEYPSTFMYSSLGSYKRFTIFIPNSFATMRLNEFATEQFSAVYFSHGIPLALNTNQRIKPEIILTTNAAWGEAPNGISSMEKGYYESGFYLRNLLSNFIFRYGLSVHYRYGPYKLDKEIDNWAFKLGVEFAL